MFGRQHSDNSSASTAALKITAMPAEFYAGANPVIKFKNVEKEVSLDRQALEAAEKRMIDKATAAGAGRRWHPANLLINRRFFIIAGSAVFIIFIIGAGIYYWGKAAREQQASEASRVAAETASAPAAPAPAAPALVPEEAPGAETPPPPQPSSLAAEPLLELPSVLLADSADLDGDDLSDLAEETFRTDPGIPDTDGDGHNDGHEVYHLYNPDGKEPMKLADSNLITEFANPLFGYQLYYPKDWAVGNTDSDYKQVLFSVLTGDNIEVRVSVLEQGQTFADWFGRFAPGEKFGDLRNFTTVFKEEGQRRDDYLTYYFTDGRLVYAIIYHTTDSDVVNYRAVIKMMARSFQLTGNKNIVTAPLPEGANRDEIIAGAAGATITPAL